MALGAAKNGVKVAASYPGTPATEILESLSRYREVYVEWSTNEKVALEVAIGASYAGVRALATMKHVGLNVAADPFFAVAYTGVKGGLVIVSADDPGVHSSQNEQDNRHYAKSAKVPMLEPSDSQEAFALMAEAYAISEGYDTPVLFRSTTRVSHSKAVVEYDDEAPQPAADPAFDRHPQKYVMIPAYARARHPIVEQRLLRLAEHAESFPYNQVLMQDSEIGIIASGAAFQYAREVFPTASFLKLAMTYPLPRRKIATFARQVKRLIVIEELDPFLEEAVRAMGLEVVGKQFFPITGEYSPETVRAGARQAGLLNGDDAEAAPIVKPPLPARPPALCPGCPHSAFYYTVNRLGIKMQTRHPDGESKGAGTRRTRPDVMGDIGCYTLGTLPPLNALDSCLCMGASIGNAIGMQKAGVRERVFAAIGDSTFLHSGVTGLIDMVYNRAAVTVAILDNGTTAMTGHQEHPGTGLTVRGEPTKAVSFEALAKAIGVEEVHTVDAQDLKKMETILRRTAQAEGPAVIIVKGDCALRVKRPNNPPVVDEEKCTGCGICFRLGCPAIARIGKKAVIDPSLCASCYLCSKICPKKIIVVPEYTGIRGEKA